MVDSGAERTPSAKVVLLAVHAATQEDVTTLQELKAQYPKALSTTTFLRILLTHLPETLETSKYLPLLYDAISEVASTPQSIPIDWTPVKEISNVEAKEKVRRLHLLQLSWPAAPNEIVDDSFTLFLLHRAHRVDAQTGLITQLPELVAPFLDRSQYLRTWFISILLPLLRLTYEYHPQSNETLSLERFESLSARSGITYLLSQTGVDQDGRRDSVGQDVRGLVGPWLYGEHPVRQQSLDSMALDMSDRTRIDNTVECWEEVFSWIAEQATKSWSTAVALVEQWDGPGDIDLGGYGDQSVLMDEENQRSLEKRFAQTALTAAYLFPDSTIECLAGAYRVLSRIVNLLELDPLPGLSTAASLLSPVELSDTNILSTGNAKFIRQHLLARDNLLTQPSTGAAQFMESLLLSAFLLTRAGRPCTLKRAGELVLIQDSHQQLTEAQALLHALGRNASKHDDKSWIRIRNEILWLRDWGAEELGDATDVGSRGILGRVSKGYLEVEILILLLSNSRFDLARSIYETSPERPLTTDKLRDTVLSLAMNAYDNATNANRTRGGVKRCDDIIHAFPDTFKDFAKAQRLEHLLKATHSLGNYRLVLKQGEPFTPVVLRVHHDPIALIGKVLDLNPRSYTKVKDLADMGCHMVQAGLIGKHEDGFDDATVRDGLMTDARLRITSMCVDAALAEDDFETAYSFVMSNLENKAKPALASVTPTVPDAGSGLIAQPLPKVIDDWSWRAALQTGKYRRNERTTKPTHLGNASSNAEIRHLEQRMECLSLALRLGPASTLQEILNVYRRCEEELDTQLKKEAEQEAAWDDEGDQTLPGAFGPTTTKPDREVTRGNDEAPMSLFDLTRASASQAQKSFSAFAALQSRASEKISGRGASSVGIADEQRGPRKRDQLRDAAAGTLASGIGWLIGAPPVVRDQHDET